MQNLHRIVFVGNYCHYHQYLYAQNKVKLFVHINIHYFTVVFCAYIKFLSDFISNFIFVCFVLLYVGDNENY